MLRPLRLIASNSGEMQHFLDGITLSPYAIGCENLSKKIRVCNSCQAMLYHILPQTICEISELKCSCINFLSTHQNRSHPIYISPHAPPFPAQAYPKGWTCDKMQPKQMSAGLVAKPSQVHVAKIGVAKLAVWPMSGRFALSDSAPKHKR